MTMPTTFRQSHPDRKRVCHDHGRHLALHGNLTDFVVKGFVNYSYTCSLALGYGGVPTAKHVRLEDVNFVANHNKFAIWIQSTPAYFVGAGIPPERGERRWTISNLSTARSRATAARYILMAATTR